jgi:hypothetical protein
MLAPPLPSPRFPPTFFLRVIAPLLLLMTVILFLTSQQRLRTRFALAGALLVFVALAGCSKNSTKAGTYPITITGTSSGATTQTLNITVVVAAN